MNLTAGAITKILNGEVSSEIDLMPVLQVTELKMIQSNRYKFLLSDGIHLQAGMLNTTLNSLVIQGSIQLGSIVRLTHYVCSLIQGRR